MTAKAEGTNQMKVSDIKRIDYPESPLLSDIIYRLRVQVAELQQENQKLKAENATLRTKGIDAGTF